MTTHPYWQIFGNRSFRRFWFGFTFSVLGDALSKVALTWLVYDQTHSAVALGWLMICYTGPIAIGGFLAGWLLDRFPRRSVMIADNIIRGSAMALIPLLAVTGNLAIWHLYLVAAIYGLFMMIALAGGPTLIPSLIEPELLPTANALEMLSFTLGGVIGSLLAGILISTIGAAQILVIDALSYAIFAILLIGVHERPVEQHRSQSKQANLGDAIRLLYTQPILMSTTLMFLVFNIGGGLLGVCLPIVADQWLGGGAALYGSLLAILAGGEVVGAIIAGQMNLQLAYGIRICIAQALAGAALVLMILSKQVWLCAIGLALFGIASAPLTIWAQTLRMQIIPDHLRGRSFALLRTLMQSGNPIGGALGALLLPIGGIAVAIAAAAALVGVSGIVGATVPELRHDQIETNKYRVNSDE